MTEQKVLREFDHFSIVPFKAICGADRPNQTTSQTPERVKCPICWQYWKEWEVSRRFQGQPAEDERVKRLANYVSHHDGCEWWGDIPRTNCTCGLSDLLDGLPPIQPAPKYEWADDSEFLAGSGMIAGRCDYRYNGCVNDGEVINGVWICRNHLNPPVQPAQQEDDGWVTFGRIKEDAENETRTFERIPAASTPTDEKQAQALAQEIAVEVGRYLVLGGISDAAVDDVAHNIILPRIVAAASAEAQDERNRF